MRSPQQLHEGLIRCGMIKEGVEFKDLKWLTEWMSQAEAAAIAKFKEVPENQRGSYLDRHLQEMKERE